MKGINSFDENGYWSRYSNDNWSVCKIYDDVLGYEYALSGERFDALEIVDKLASLEAENAKLREQTRWIPVGERLPKERQDVLALDRTGTAYHWQYSKSLSNIFIGEYTHWMPLTSVPESEDK